MTATNWYYTHLIYRDLPDMLELLTKLVIKQQIHPALLKCKGTHELQNCCFGKQEGVEYKEMSTIDYIHYYIALSLHFCFHCIMRAAVINWRLSTPPGSYTSLFPVEVDLLSYIGCFSHSPDSSPHGAAVGPQDLHPNGTPSEITNYITWQQQSTTHLEQHSG